MYAVFSLQLSKIFMSQPDMNRLIIKLLIFRNTLLMSFVFAVFSLQLSSVPYVTTRHESSHLLKDL